LIVIIAGLTGSIAMGKSTVAGMFAALGCVVFDADAAVRKFHESEGAAAMEAAFPGVVVNGVVDRELLASRALVDPTAIARLEAIVHPAVAEQRTHFLRRAHGEGRRIALLDVPLLFETGGDLAADLVIVVSANPHNQRARALSRPGMTLAKLELILSRQTPDNHKRRHAHFVIDTNSSLRDTAAEVAGLVRSIASMGGRGMLNA
jgi:dephospho-CoA kinase